MAKYYVTSGGLQWCGTARTSKEAAINALNSAKENNKGDIPLGRSFFIDQRGFRTDFPYSYSFDDLGLLDPDDTGRATKVYDTRKILQAAGWDVER